MGEETLRSDMAISKRAAMALRRYDWPGNVRELSNVLERALSSTGGATIHLHDLPFYLHDLERPTASRNPSSIREIQAVAEKEAIQFALKETGNNKARAARLLGIHRTLLYKKMKKHGLPL
jgi:transcriptional regulator with PAS, ATPase and Fis domain